jgi:hypothetical protein
VAAVVAGSWLCASAARAEAGDASDPPPVVQGREAFRRGTQLAKDGQWANALAEFERSAQLKPHAQTTYNVGFCERALGRYTRARRSFVQALSAPAGEMPPELAAEARGYLAEIDSLLARVLVTQAPGGTAIAVDGRPLQVTQGAGLPAEIVAGTREPGPAEPVPAASFTLVTDPGAHVILVRVPGAPEQVITRDLAPGETIRLALGSPPPAERPTRPPPSRGAIAAFGAGAGGFAAAVVFGGLALDRRSYLQGVCGSRCPQAAQPSIDRMDGFATASTVGAVVAGAGALLGTVLWLTAPKPPVHDGASDAGGARRRPGAPIRAALWVGPLGTGVRVPF